MTLRTLTHVFFLCFSMSFLGAMDQDNNDAIQDLVAQLEALTSKFDNLSRTVDLQANISVTREREFKETIEALRQALDSKVKTMTDKLEANEGKLAEVERGLTAVGDIDKKLADKFKQPNDAHKALAASFETIKHKVDALELALQTAKTQAVAAASSGDAIQKQPGRAQRMLTTLWNARAVALTATLAYINSCSGAYCPTDQSAHYLNMALVAALVQDVNNKISHLMNG